MHALSGITRGLNQIGSFLLRAAENSAQRLAALAALGTFATLMLIADGRPERIAAAAGFAAGLLSLAAGIILWMMPSRSIRRREGRGLAIFSLCALLALGILMANRNLRLHIALIGNSLNSSP